MVETSASEKEGGKWIGAYHTIYQDEDGKAGDRASTAHSQKKRVGKAQIPVGKYILISTYNDFEKETPFEVKSGEVTKIHVVFEQFLISSKCLDSNSKVYYEIYASNGQLIYEKSVTCSKTLKVSLNNGKYSIEAKVGENIGEATFTVGTNKVNKLILDLSNLNHEDEIEADSAETVVVPVKPKNSEKITIGSKEIEIKGMSKDEAKQLKDLSTMIGALSGMMQPLNNKESKEKQNIDNTKADKVFDEMSKELDMFTK